MKIFNLICKYIFKKHFIKLQIYIENIFKKCIFFDFKNFKIILKIYFLNINYSIKRAFPQETFVILSFNTYLLTLHPM